MPEEVSMQTPEESIDRDELDIKNDASVDGAHLEVQAEKELQVILNYPDLEDKEIPAYSQEEVFGLVTELTDGANFDDKNFMNRVEGIKAWVSANPDVNIGLLEKEFAGHFDWQKENSGQLNLPTLFLLGEIQQYRRHGFVNNELAKNLELTPRRGLSAEMRDQLASLNQLNDPRGNLTLHKIMDFMQEHMFTVQDHTEREIEEMLGHEYSGMTVDFYNFARAQVRVSKNYLVKKHYQDIIDSINIDDSDKEGALAGVPGGATDETIYTFQHVQESYNNRIALGVNEGYPIANPVVPIAPGYFGYYRNGALEKVYAATQAEYAKAQMKEKEYIARNNPEDDYIYDQINEPQQITGRHNHPSHGLQKLQLIWDFTDQLKSNDRKFFFDISRLDMSELHPIVAADFLTKNQEYITEEEGKDNGAKPLTQEEFTEKLFPLHNESPDKKYHYQNLTKLHMRKKIEDDFGIDIAGHDFWEQRNFLSFLESQTTDKVDTLIEYTKKYGNDGLTTFLSIELDPAMGERILSIGENLTDSPELAKQLFREYAAAAHQADQTAEEIITSFNLIYPDKHIDKNEVVEAVLIKAKDLLFNVSEEIETTTSEDKEAIVNQAITHLKKQLATQKKEIGEFGVIAKELNGKYQEMLNSELGTKLVNDLAEFQKNIPDLDDAELRERLLQEQEISGKFSSARISEIIDYYRHEVDFEQSEEFQIFRGQLSADQLSEYIAKQKQKIETTYKPLIQKLEKLLSFQVNFEKKLEQIVIGRESGALPKNLLERLPEEVQEIRPERLPDKEPLYFPVGITKDLPAMQEVWAGKKETAKPIDMYGYLFWLNNQGRPVELVICDEIQTSNYQALYPELVHGSEDQAREQSRRIGKQEAEQYQKIIETFELSNITLIDYRAFKERNGDAMARYKGLCERLSKNESWKNAFLSMVQESVSGEEREKFLAYAIEEVSWILSNDGTKVSHENEARYDAIAAVIRNIENYGEKQKIDILDPANETQFNQAASAAISGLRNLINGRKDHTVKDSSEYHYYQRIGEHVGKIKLGQVGQPDDFDKKSITFNFAVPSTGSQSFGWRSRETKGDKSKLNFREPYSTYSYRRGAEVFLNSDQVVAVGEGQIAGKILALDIKQQHEYAEKVVKPILVHYFKTLEKAPAEFFERIGKTQTELMAECQASETLMDVLRFVQKYIIAPVQHREIKSIEPAILKQKAA
ncbi:MAG: hypothetical protein WC495_04620 [Patescibacteria group bacterium]